MASALVPAELAKQFEAIGMKDPARVEVFKRFGGYHEPINEYTTWSSRLTGYHSWLWGYQYPGHGVYVSSDDVKKLNLPDEVRLISTFVLYQLSRAHRDFEIREKAAKPLPFLEKETATFRNSPEIESLRQKLRFTNSNELPQSGSYYLVPSERLVGTYMVKDSKESCLLEYGDILVLKKSEPLFSEVQVINQNPTPTLARLYVPGTCTTGQTVTIKTPSLIGMNLKYWREAFTRNFIHQKLVEQKIGRYKTTTVLLGAALNICSGVPYSQFHHSAIATSAGWADIKRNYVFTNGSFENIAHLEHGTCDFGIYQDASANMLKKFLDAGYKQFIAERRLEAAFFFCKKESGITKLEEITANHKILLGEPNSTSDFVLQDLASRSPNLAKVRSYKRDPYTGLGDFFAESSPYHCLLTVQNENSAMVKLIENSDKVQLVYRSADITFKLLARKDISPRQLSTLLENTKVEKKIEICSSPQSQIVDDFSRELSAKYPNQLRVESFQTQAELLEKEKNKTCEFVVLTTEQAAPLRGNRNAFAEDLLLNEKPFFVCPKGVDRPSRIFYSQDYISDFTVRPLLNAKPYIQMTKVPYQQLFSSVAQNPNSCFLYYSYQSKILRYKDPVLLAHAVPQFKVQQVEDLQDLSFVLLYRPKLTAWKNQIQNDFGQSIVGRKVEQ